ncbi:MAG TPA: YdcF family protein [Enterobacteriaceae bacterium]|nr:YdcF family protein [Enterobacteriaceae bacterium]
MKNKRSYRHSGSRLLMLTIGALFSLQSAAFSGVTQPEASFDQYVTQRQTVDMLVADALQAFKNPARISGAGFTGKTASNMEIVAEKLLQAHQLEPYRVDLLFSAASAFIYNGNIDKAVTLYQQILSDAPGDVDALIYLSAWNRFLKQNAESDKSLAALKAIDPLQAEKVTRFFKAIDDASAIKITDSLTAAQVEQINADGSTPAIVTLGYALNPDGTMNEVLIQRLEKTLEVAKQLPESLIIVTGGVPQNGKTEGKLMADWLVSKGIDAKRIYQENYARSTVENALYSRYGLAKHRVKDAVIISSGSHVRRAEAIFQIAGWQTGPHDIRFTTVAALDKPLKDLQTMGRPELQGIYRDGLKALGLWSFRSPPLEER